jgi:LCP family protein required for cell wall assembly
MNPPDVDTAPVDPVDVDRKRRSPHRTWGQRLTIVVVIVTALACFTAAGAIAAGQWVLSQRNLVTLDAAPTERRNDTTGVVVPDDSTEPSATTQPTDTTVPLVLAEPEAANFLIVGADNNDCEGDQVTDERNDLGERSDTIMVWRANPETNQLAVLSFPRDLYVEYPGGRQRRINEAFQRDDPSRLQEVIAYNFDIEIDHYVQIDFCAFRRIVDAVGGVAIPFEFPARDVPVPGGPPLFVIDQTGCVNLDGTTALAYVRSRHYQFEDPPGSGRWQTDPTSDFGRIARQQDFLRRMLAKVIDQGLYDPDVASALITTNSQYLTTDTGLTLRRMLEFANALRNFDADQVATYRIESQSATRGGASVELPRIENENMRAILAIFRGEATLASAPEQVIATTPPSTDGSVTTTTIADDDPDDERDDGRDDASVDSTLPTVAPTENTLGQAPDRNVSC